MRTIQGFLISGLALGGLGGCVAGDLGDGAIATDSADEAATIAPQGDAETPVHAMDGCDAGVFVGDLTINNQADLAALEGYTEITGSILFDPDAEITEISGLDCLLAVGGSIVMYEQPELVTGFQNLRSVGGNLGFSDDDHSFAPSAALAPLSTVSIFNELRSVGGALYFHPDHRREALVLDGFHKLRTIGGNLAFGGADFEVYGFDELEEIGGKLRGSDTGTPDDIAIYGLNELSSVSEIEFQGVGQVVISGLNDLERVDGDLAFLYTGDVSIDGLTDLERIDGDFVFDEAGAVVLTGLGELERIDGDLVFNEAGPLDTTPLVELEYIAGDLFIESGPEDDSTQMSVLELSELEHLGGDFYIEGYGSPMQLGAFAELEYIGGDLTIDEADDLGDIVGFNELEHVAGSVFFNEPTGARLVGFAELETVGGSFEIKEAKGLSDFYAFGELEEVGGDFVMDEVDDAISFATFAELSRIGGNLTITDNGELETLGLDELDELGGTHLRIEGNELLCTCEAQALADHLVAEGFTGTVTIANNAICE